MHCMDASEAVVREWQALPLSEATTDHSLIAEARWLNGTVIKHTVAVSAASREWLAND